MTTIDIMSGRRVLAYVVREPYRAYDDTDYFTVAGAAVQATPERDVCLDVVEADEPGREIYPACPDCGGRLAWAEAGRVPGSRACVGAGEDQEDGCGSAFADSRFAACFGRHTCARHPAPAQETQR